MGYICTYIRIGKIALSKVLKDYRISETDRLSEFHSLMITLCY